MNSFFFILMHSYSFRAFVGGRPHECEYITIYVRVIWPSFTSCFSNDI